MGVEDKAAEGEWVLVEDIGCESKSTEFDFLGLDEECVFHVFVEPQLSDDYDFCYDQAEEKEEEKKRRKNLMAAKEPTGGASETLRVKPSCAICEGNGGGVAEFHLCVRDAVVVNCHRAEFGPIGPSKKVDADDSNGSTGYDSPFGPIGPSVEEPEVSEIMGDSTGSVGGYSLFGPLPVIGGPILKV